MKKWLIIGMVAILLIGGLVGYFISQGGIKIGTPGQGPITSDTIQVPEGPKIKVIFNGPSELKVSWEKLGMAGFQLHLIGTLTNVSQQTVEFLEIAFLLDGQQMAFISGWALEPGEEMEITKGFPGYSESTKVLEVKIKGFQKIGDSVAPSPSELTTPEPEMTPEEVVMEWYSLMQEEKFSEVIKLYTPSAQQEIESSGGVKTLEKAWQENTVTKMEIEKTEVRGSEAYVYALFDYVSGVTGDRVSFRFNKTNGQWKIVEGIIGEI